MNRRLQSTILFFFCCAAGSALLESCGSSGEVQGLSARERFEQGKARFDDEDYREAIDDFTAVTLQYPGSDVADDAQFYLGECRYRRGEYLLAAYEYETLRRNMPASPFDASAQYMIGLCYYDLSPRSSLDQINTKKAIDEFQSFIEYFPTHELTPDAEAKIRELTDKLAEKDYNTAVLYMKMGNPKGATFYFDSVLDKYHDSRYAERAHVGKVEALVARNKHDDARTEIEKFRARYPNSEFRDAIDSLERRVNDNLNSKQSSYGFSEQPREGNYSR